MSLWKIGYKLHENREGLVTSISPGSQSARGTQQAFKKDLLDAWMNGWMGRWMDRYF